MEHLPTELLAHILTFLPFPYVVKTCSVVSRKWAQASRASHVETGPVSICVNHLARISIYGRSWPQLRAVLLPRGTEEEDLVPVCAFGGLRVVKFASPNPRIIHLDTLSACVSLLHLDISFTAAADLSPLSTLTQLTFLSCERTRVSSIAVITSFPRLKYLDANECPISDIRPLQNHPSLTKALLRRTRISNISSVFNQDGNNNAAALKVLYLTGSPVGNAEFDGGMVGRGGPEGVYLRATSVTEIGGVAWSGLRVLDLGLTDVSEITALSWCVHLHTLDLEQTKVCDISALSHCVSLHTLWLTLTRVKDIHPLASHRSLRVLSLRSTPVHDILPLSTCENLETLNLCRTLVTDVTPLIGCKSLKTLFVGRGLHASLPEEVKDMVRFWKSNPHLALVT